MIAFIQGNIILKKEKFIIIEVSGIGYKVFLSQKTLLKLPETGQNVKLFCFQDVKENSIALYGFLDYKDLEFFEILNDIRGIGPKAAIELSSLGPLDKIKERILAQDETVFAGIHGIGKKKIMTIILELSGKIRNITAVKKGDESEDALTSLGFSRSQAKTALERIGKNLSQEERIKQALKLLGK